MGAFADTRPSSLPFLPASQQQGRTQQGWAGQPPLGSRLSPRNSAPPSAPAAPLAFGRADFPLLPLQGHGCALSHLCAGRPQSRRWHLQLQEENAATVTNVQRSSGFQLQDFRELLLCLSHSSVVLCSWEPCAVPPQSSARRAAPCWLLGTAHR